MSPLDPACFARSEKAGNPLFISPRWYILDVSLTNYVLYDIIISMNVNAYSETNLKRIRTIYGCSQKKLAEMSGVSLRSIQMYEQRNKDINKAQSESLYRLAKALGCKMEDLLEE